MDPKAFAELFNKTVEQGNKKVDYEYRLYYNKETGEPLQYTTEVLEGNDYLVLSKQQYALGSYDVKIINGELRTLNSFEQWTKLVPSKDGVSTRVDNVMIVDMNGSTKWKLKTFYRE